MKFSRITHDHKVALGILLISGIFDLSFCAEKLLLHYGLLIKPMTWAVIYGTLGVVTLIGAIIELILDTKSDCKEVQCCEEKQKTE